MKKVMSGIFVVTLAAGLLMILFSSCSSNNGKTRTAPVALYLTDDLSTYKQMIATITSAQILNTGSGAACDVLAAPVTVNIAELTSMLQLVDVAQCPVTPYNRIRIEFAKSVQLMDQTGASSLCSFGSSRDEVNRPNVLLCSGPTCTLDINGAVNVLAGQQNKLALDFDLKNFAIDRFTDPATCSVTMKVSPLHAEEIEVRGHPEGVTGLISGLSTTDRTFLLTRGNKTFSVLYSGITPTWQPGIDRLLQLAQTNDLRVKVISSRIDVDAANVLATTIFVKLEGTVSDLDAPAHLFTLAYEGGKTIRVDYSAAAVEGTLADIVWVELKLYGFDGGNYRASIVESGTSGMSTDD